MRVAFVSMYTLHTRDTPAIRRRTRLIDLLAQSSHEVIVLCSQWWDGDHPEFEQEGINYRAVESEFSRGRFAAKLPFALRKESPDIVHIPNTPARLARAAKPTCRLLRIPMVVNWWASGPDDSNSDCESVASERREQRRPHRRPIGDGQNDGPRVWGRRKCGHGHPRGPEFLDDRIGPGQG